MNNYVHRYSRNDAIVAGQKPFYTFSIAGGQMNITNETDVQAIDKIIKEAKANDWNIIDYLNYMINEENIIGINNKPKVWDDCCN